MPEISNSQFLRTMPHAVLPFLPPALSSILVRQPFSWLIQFHYGEPRLHYEVARAQGRDGWELGFHCEANDKRLNRYLLDGFRRHLFEIKDALGEGIEAEMWDRGWTKIYEVRPSALLTTEFQLQTGHRLATIIRTLHPIYVELRGAVAEIYR